MSEKTKITYATLSADDDTFETHYGLTAGFFSEDQKEVE